MDAVPNFDFLYGNTYIPESNSIMAIGGGVQYRFDLDLTSISKQKCPQFSFTDACANAFPTVRLAEDKSYVIPFDGQNHTYSRILFEVNIDPAKTRLLSSAPACNFTGYTKFGHSMILAYDWKQRDYQCFNGFEFIKIGSLWPNHPEVFLVSFCDKVYVIDQNSDEIAVLNYDHDIDIYQMKVSQVQIVNRPKCKRWFVDAVTDGLAVMFCETDIQGEEFQCLLDLTKLEIIAVSQSYSENLHFPWITEAGVLCKSAIPMKLSDALCDQFTFDYDVWLARRNVMLVKWLKTAPEWEKSVYQKCGLDLNVKTELPLGEQLLGCKIFVDIIAKLKADYQEKIDSIKKSCDDKIQTLEREITELKK